ncbi:RNI-like protein [Hesseltinella vesiculosa]|uniref:RNI-like protein n=1 Tax=Hesseltinella vesiculosa TaxID=101127 RepID=A0A1X2GCX0_9FUNG|nr:RNI-like protein [Hesseltinella vesiculosa]
MSFSMSSSMSMNTTPPSSPQWNDFTAMKPYHHLPTAYASPPISPLQSDNLLRKESPPMLDQPLEWTNRILHSGPMVLCSPQSRFSRQKKCFCVLTGSALVRFKSSDKAVKAYPGLETNGSEELPPSVPLDQQKIVVALDTVYAVHKVALSPFQSGVRIDYVNTKDRSVAPSHAILYPVDHAALKSWIQALRQAIEPYLLGLVSIGSAEQFSAFERFKKQKDASGSSSSLIHKVLLKTSKHYSQNNTTSHTPAPASSSGSGNKYYHMHGYHDTNNNTSVPIEQKDIYVPIVLALGDNSLYLLPSKSEHADYRRYVKRDRYGLLSIHRMVIRDDDDTILFEMCTGHGPLQTLVLVSSIGRLLVCSIIKAVQTLLPHVPEPPYTLVYEGTAPDASQKASESKSPLASWHRVLVQPWTDRPIQLGKQPLQTMNTLLESLLMSYCAALNLDKRRFRYELTQAIHGLPRFHLVVLPPNEINGNFSSYSRLELLAYFRSLRHLSHLESISFKDIRLHPIAMWKVGKEDGWTMTNRNVAGTTTMLAQELYLLLFHNHQLRALDLSGSNSQHVLLPSLSHSSPTSPVSDTQPNTMRRTASLTRVPTSLSTVSLHRTMTNNSHRVPAQHTTSSPGEPVADECSAACSVQGILLALAQVKGTSDLSTLRCDGYTWHDQDIERLVHMLTPIGDSPFLALNHLSLRNAQISTWLMEALLVAICQGPAAQCLDHLDLQENPGLVSVDVFHQVWRQCYRLTHLAMPCALEDGDDLGLLSPAKLLNVLDLSGSQLNDDHVLALANWLTHHANHLRPPTKTKFDLKLILERCGLHGQHVHHLCRAIAVQHHRRLRFHLHLGGNPLAKAVQHQPWLWASLTHHGPYALSLQHVTWETNAFRELLDALRQNLMVQKVDLSNCKMEKNVKSSTQPTSPSMLTASFEQQLLANQEKKSGSSMSSSLITADTDNIDPSLTTTLAAFLGTKEGLEVFAMDYSPRHDLYDAVPASSKRAIEKAKSTMFGLLLSSTFYHLSCYPSMANTTLTHLSVQHHGLGDRAMAALCTWAKTCTSLQSLHVDGNQMTIAGMRALLDLAKHLDSLHELPRPELDFRRELQRLEAQAWHLQESEAEMQYLVIHMVGMDSKRARALIEEQVVAREAIMVDRSQLPLVMDQLHQQIQDNLAKFQRQHKHKHMHPYWPSASTVQTSPKQRTSFSLTPLPTPQTASFSSSATATSMMSRPTSAYSIFDEPLPPPTCPLPPIPTQSSS